MWEVANLYEGYYIIIVTSTVAAVVSVTILVVLYRCQKARRQQKAQLTAQKALTDKSTEGKAKRSPKAQRRNSNQKSNTSDPVKRHDGARRDSNASGSSGRKKKRKKSKTGIGKDDEEEDSSLQDVIDFIPGDRRNSKASTDRVQQTIRVESVECVEQTIEEKAIVEREASVQESKVKPNKGGVVNGDARRTEPVQAEKNQQRPRSAKGRRKNADVQDNAEHNMTMGKTDPVVRLNEDSSSAFSSDDIGAAMQPPTQKPKPGKGKGKKSAANGEDDTSTASDSNKENVSRDYGNHVAEVRNKTEVGEALKKASDKSQKRGKPKESHRKEDSVPKQDSNIQLVERPATVTTMIVDTIDTNSNIEKSAMMEKPAKRQQQTGRPVNDRSTDSKLGSQQPSLENGLPKDETVARAASGIGQSIARDGRPSISPSTEIAHGATNDLGPIKTPVTSDRPIIVESGKKVRDAVPVMDTEDSVNTNGDTGTGGKSDIGEGNDESTVTAEEMSDAKGADRSAKRKKRPRSARSDDGRDSKKNEPDQDRVANRKPSADSRESTVNGECPAPGDKNAEKSPAVETASRDGHTKTNDRKSDMESGRPSSHIEPTAADASMASVDVSGAQCTEPIRQKESAGRPLSHSDDPIDRSMAGESVDDGNTQSASPDARPMSTEDMSSSHNTGTEESSDRSQPSVEKGYKIQEEAPSRPMRIEDMPVMFIGSSAPSAKQAPSKAKKGKKQKKTKEDRKGSQDASATPSDGSDIGPANVDRRNEKPVETGPRAKVPSTETAVQNAQPKHAEQSLDETGESTPLEISAQSNEPNETVPEICSKRSPASGLEDPKCQDNDSNDVRNESVSHTIATDKRSDDKPAVIGTEAVVRPTSDSGPAKTEGQKVRDDKSATDDAASHKPKTAERRIQWSDEADVSQNKDNVQPSILEIKNNDSSIPQATVSNDIAQKRDIATKESTLPSVDEPKDHHDDKHLTKKQKLKNLFGKKGKHKDDDKKKHGKDKGSKPRTASTSSSERPEEVPATHVPATMDSSNQSPVSSVEDQEAGSPVQQKDRDDRKQKEQPETKTQALKENVPVGKSVRNTSEGNTLRQVPDENYTPVGGNTASQKRANSAHVGPNQQAKTDKEIPTVHNETVSPGTAQTMFMPGRFPDSSSLESERPTGHDTLSKATDGPGADRPVTQELPEDTSASKVDPDAKGLSPTGVTIIESQLPERVEVMDIPVQINVPNEPIERDAPKEGAAQVNVPNEPIERTVAAPNKTAPPKKKKKGKLKNLFGKKKEHEDEKEKEKPDKKVKGENAPLSHVQDPLDEQKVPQEAPTKQEEQKSSSEPATKPMLPYTVETQSDLVVPTKSAPSKESAQVSTQASEPKDENVFPKVDAVSEHPNDHSVPSVDDAEATVSLPSETALKLRVDTNDLHSKRDENEDPYFTGVNNVTEEDHVTVAVTPHESNEVVAQEVPSNRFGMVPETAAGDSEVPHLPSGELKIDCAEMAGPVPNDSDGQQELPVRDNEHSPQTSKNDTQDRESPERFTERNEEQKTLRRPVTEKVGSAPTQCLPSPGAVPEKRRSRPESFAERRNADKPDEVDETPVNDRPQVETSSVSLPRHTESLLPRTDSPRTKAIPTVRGVNEEAAQNQVAQVQPHNDERDDAVSQVRLQDKRVEQPQAGPAPVRIHSSLDEAQTEMTDQPGISDKFFESDTAVPTITGEQNALIQEHAPTSMNIQRESPKQLDELSNQDDGKPVLNDADEMRHPDHRKSRQELESNVPESPTDLGTDVLKITDTGNTQVVLHTPTLETTTDNTVAPIVASSKQIEPSKALLEPPSPDQSNVSPSSTMERKSAKPKNKLMSLFGKKKKPDNTKLQAAPVENEKPTSKDMPSPQVSKSKKGTLKNLFGKKKKKEIAPAVESVKPPESVEQRNLTNDTPADQVSSTSSLNTSSGRGSMASGLPQSLVSVATPGKVTDSLGSLGVGSSERYTPDSVSSATITFVDRPEISEAVVPMSTEPVRTEPTTDVMDGRSEPVPVIKVSPTDIASSVSIDPTTGVMVSQEDIASSAGMDPTIEVDVQPESVGVIEVSPRVKPGKPNIDKYNAPTDSETRPQIVVDDVQPTMDRDVESIDFSPERSDDTIEALDDTTHTLGPDEPFCPLAESSDTALNNPPEDKDTRRESTLTDSTVDEDESDAPRSLSNSGSNTEDLDSSYDGCHHKFDAPSLTQEDTNTRNNALMPTGEEPTMDMDETKSLDELSEERATPVPVPLEELFALDQLDVAPQPAERHPSDSDGTDALNTSFDPATSSGMSESEPSESEPKRLQKKKSLLRMKNPFRKDKPKEPEPLQKFASNSTIVERKPSRLKSLFGGKKKSEEKPKTSDSESVTAKPKEKKKLKLSFLRKKNDNKKDKVPESETDDEVVKAGQPAAPPIRDLTSYETSDDQYESDASVMKAGFLSQHDYSSGLSTGTLSNVSQKTLCMDWRLVNTIRAHYMRLAWEERFHENLACMAVNSGTSWSYYAVVKGVGWPHKFKFGRCTYVKVIVTSHDKARCRQMGEIMRRVIIRKSTPQCRSRAKHLWRHLTTHLQTRNVGVLVFTTDDSNRWGMSLPTSGQYCYTKWDNFLYFAWLP